MTNEQKEAIARNFEKFCRSSGIPAAVLVAHGKYGEDHFILHQSPGVCKLVDSLAEGLDAIINDKGLDDNKPFKFDLN